MALVVMVMLMPAWAQSGNDNTDQTSYGPGKILDDNRPLSGAEFLGLGTPERDRNVVNASIQADERADSNAAGVGTATSWTEDTDLYGSAMLNRSWSRNSFTAQYAGGGTWVGESDLQNTQFFKAAQVFGWDRAALTLSDQVTYSPQAPFGYPGPWAFSIGNVGTKPILVPNQTVLTDEATRVANVSSAEVDYGLTRRSTLTAVGSYGLLDFFTNQAVNSNQVKGILGYNYAVTPHSTFALAYGYSGINFLDDTPGSPGHSRTEVQTASASYGFQATGRLSFQLAAGSQLVKSFIPGTASYNNVYPFGQIVMTYAWHRTTLGLLGSQSIMSGGGLYPASKATLAQVSLSRLLTRKWEGAVLGGYARNSPLQTYLSSGSQLSNTGYAGATLRRSLGRHAGLYFLYNFERQDVDNSFCTGVLCAQSFLRHSFGVGVDWRFTPWYFHVKED